MFRLMRLPDGNALLIHERDGKRAAEIEAEYVEAVSQALGHYIGETVKDE